MLKIIYNDSYSQLTIANNLNNEKIVVIDDDFKVYEEIDYSYYEPLNSELLLLWEKALLTYFCIKQKDKTLFEYRYNMFDKSLVAFKEWLNKHNVLWGGEE